MSAPLLEVAASRGKLVLALLGAAGFVVLGLFLAMRGTGIEVWVGWVCVAFFGAGIPLFLKQLLDARPRVVLDEVGVLDRTLGVGRIPWTEIEGAYISRIQGNPFVCLRLHDPERWTRELNAVQRRMVKANEKLGFQPLNINLTGTSVDPERVLDVVLRKSAEHSRAGKDGVG